MDRKIEKQMRKYESWLAKDLGVDSVPPMQVLDLETGGVPEGSLLPRTAVVANRSGMVQVVTGGMLKLADVRFGYVKVSEPRPLEVQLFAINMSTNIARGVYATSFALAAPLRKPVAGPVRLGDETESDRNNFTARNLFEGDRETAALLNADRDLLKQAALLPVTRRTTAKTTEKLGRHLEIRPIDAQRSALIVRTLPDILMTRTGFRARQTLEFAAAVEARL
ncbi:hypothetical protein [Actinoallomurus sp. NPDC050550]|uniref:hypothetical protein n=1 Tax=Actinoallomurus sp. NPDC050550 TaxID=3154937 RepID=UPI0033C9153E